ncbi:hypothetical protein J437_LFUL014708 [Ladona fulva]|uniref:SEFIR domain-containing protein n=1 Tax=Ladona fulva TaxID=123851 RepID=A0A8K0KA91_LADFU|nr:hypothetical protein J437_LFUL014708 [Ladona fulva]
MIDSGIPYNPIYVSIALAAATLLILLCFCFKILGSKGQDLPSQPSLLLIYRSTHTSHIRVVVELAKYLRNNCNIDAMVDELDVNRSKSQDPFDWYNGAISGADFIAVVSSPTCCNSINGIYPKAYDAALCLLRGSAFKRENFAKKCKLMVFMLPYGSERHLPVETKNIGLHFQIPLHLMDVSRYIHNFKKMYFFEKYYYFVKARVKFLWNIIKNKNCTHNTCDWPEMQKAIQEATLEIKKCERNIGRTDLKVDCSQQTRDIYHESEKETVALGDSLVIDSCTPPLDNVTVFAEYPIPLDDIDLLGLKVEVTDVETQDSRDDPLDHLEL